MARKPNYDFERRERDRLKAEKKAQRAAAKKDGRTTDDGEPADAETDTGVADDEPLADQD